MKAHLKALMAILSLTGFVAVPALAVAATEKTNDAQMAELASQTKQLLAEVSRLQKEVTHLKRNQAAANQTTLSQSHKHHSKHAQSHSGATETQNSGDVQDLSAKLTGPELAKMIQEQREYLPFDMDVPGQAFVSTGPYVGVPYQFAGSDLIINSPSVNTDVQLLGIRKSIHKQLTAMGGEIFKEPYHSHLLLSGLVEGQANYTNKGGKPSTTDIDITNVSLDAFFLGPSPWTLGFIELSYDNSPPSGSVFSSTNNYTVANSRIYVNKAFITIGNFNESPFYGTFGQSYVPFGRFSSVMVSDTLPKLLGRTKERYIQLGVQQQGDNAFYGAAYLFRGDSHAASVDKVNNGGLNLGYTFKTSKFGKIGMDLGGGIIGNIADSGGMQQGTGFANYEQIQHRVPGYNLRGIFNFFEHWDVIAEYIGSTTRFNPNDMSFNNHGAKPSTLDTQLAYSFYILDNKPSSVGIGYANSNQALALGLPLSRYSLVFNTSLWRNTLQSLEFRHDRNYAASDVANGPIGAETVINNTCTSATCAGTGKSDNAVTAQFDYYF